MIPGLSIPITIDLQRSYGQKINLVQGENTGRRLAFTIVSGGVAVNLTGKILLLTGTKSDGSPVCLPITISSATAGQAYCDIVSGLVSAVGDATLQIRILTPAITGTATSGTATSMYDTSKTWAVNGYVGSWLYINSGTGINQARRIVSNTATQLVVSDAWGTNPAAGSGYSIVTETGFSFPFTANVAASPDADAGIVQTGDFSALTAAIAAAYGFEPRLADVENAVTLKPDISGWSLISETWAYLSANSVTVPAGATSRFQKGDYVMLGQTTTKYFVVTAVTNTTVSLTGGSDYVVVNAAIAAVYLSRSVNPLGFPSGFNFAPVSTGFSSVPTGVTARFSVKGGVCSLSVVQSTAGTSNATTFNVSLPIQAANVAGAQWVAPAMVVDNGAVPTTPGLAVVNAAAASMALYKDYAGANFTASGAKRLAAVFLHYAI